MRLTVDLGLRKSVLRALGKVLSSERHEELQLELMKSDLATKLEYMQLILG